MTSTRTARVITDVLAPANLVMAVLLIIGWHSSTNSLYGATWGLVAALFCGGIPFAIILLGVRRGRWTDKHIHIRQQRTVPLLATMGSVLLGIALLFVLGAPRDVLALVVAMLVGLVVTLAVTVSARWKVSVHTAVASGVVVVLIIAYGMRMVPLLLGIAIIGWSRIALRDHTLAQTVVGALLGGLAAALVFGLLH